MNEREILRLVYAESAAGKLRQAETAVELFVAYGGEVPIKIRDQLRALRKRLESARGELVRQAQVENPYQAEKGD